MNAFPQRTDKRYNTLHVMEHKLGHRCFWWVDNSVVKFVSNLHYGTGNEAVLRPQKKATTKRSARFVGKERDIGCQNSANGEQLQFLDER